MRAARVPKQSRGCRARKGAENSSSCHMFTKGLEMASATSAFREAATVPAQDAPHADADMLASVSLINCELLGGRLILPRSCVLSNRTCSWMTSTTWFL